LSQSPKKRGRPRKVDIANEGGEHWADKLVRLYSEGASDVEVCAELKLSNRQFLSKERDDPVFAELVEFGRLASKAWWMQIGRKAAKLGSPAQAFNFWSANMKNRFGWNDKTEISEGRTTDSLSTDEIKSKLNKLKDKIASLPSNAEMKALLDE